MNNRRKLLIALGAGSLIAPLGTFAQQRGTVPRIGLLIAETRTGQSNRIEALRAGLRELNYVAGKNILMKCERPMEITIVFPNLRQSSLVSRSM